MIWGFLAAMIVAFFFAGLEAGITSVNRIRLRQRAREGQSEAIALDELLRHPERLLTAILILNLVARIMLISFLYVLLEKHLPPVVSLLLVLLALPVMAFLLEFLPKVFFRQSPYRRVLLLAGILRWISLPLAPMGMLLQRLGGERLSRTSAGGKRVVTAPAEVREAINSAEQGEIISPLQKHYLHSVLNTRNLTLEDLAESLTNWPNVGPGEKISKLLDRSRREGRHAYLVSEGGGEPVGMVFTFDLLLDGVRSGSCQSYMRRLPVLCPEEPPIIALLKMRAARAAWAFVQSEGMPMNIVSARTIVAHLLHGPSRVRDRTQAALPDH